MLVAPSIWKRAIAKVLDYLLLIAAFTTACTFLPIQLTVIKLLTFSFLISFAWIPFEVLLLKAFKTTPGKFLMGIGLKESLSIKKLFKISCTSAIKAFTLFLPLFNIFAAWTLIRNEPLISTYFVKKPRKFLSATLAAFFLSTLFFTTYKVADIDQTPSFFYSQTDDSNHAFCWDSFELPGAVGKVSLPSAPVEQPYQLKVPDKKEPTVDLTQLVVLDEATGMQYSVIVVDLPHNLMSWGPKMILKGSLEVAELNSEGTTLSSKKSIRHLNLPCLHYTMQGAKTEKMGRLLLIGNQLVKLEVSYPTDKKEQIQAEASEFLSSFRLK
jgi:hypothetical protein